MKDFESELELSGFQISSLRTVKPYLDGYYIYLFRDYDFKSVAASLVNDFDEYAQRTGDNSGIFRGINQEEYERSLKALFDRDPWFDKTIGDLMKLPAGVFITKPSIQDFHAGKGNVFIYVSQAVINDAYKNRIDLSQDIVDLCRHNVDTFISRILKYSRGAIINKDKSNIRLLKTIKNAVKIEPNFAGLGVDVKPIIKKAFSKFSKEKNSKPVYDCVVYRF